jgi:hypothetical protein
MISRFTAVFGSPHRALAIVICALLLGAGMGSQASINFRHFRRAKSVAVTLLILAILITIKYLPHLFDLLLQKNFLQQVFFSVIFLLPMSFLMGFPFSLGVEEVKEKFPRGLEMAWLINGAYSAFGAYVAILVSVQWGFNFLLVLGIGFYIVSIFNGQRLNLAAIKKFQ